MFNLIYSSNINMEIYRDWTTESYSLVKSQIGFEIFLRHENIQKSFHSLYLYYDLLFIDKSSQQNVLDLDLKVLLLRPNFSKSNTKIQKYVMGPKVLNLNGTQGVKLKWDPRC